MGEAESDSPSDAASSCCNTSSRGQFRAEVRGQNRQPTDEDEPGANADAKPLGEQDLPVGGAQADHHLAENDEERACGQ